MKSAKAAWRAVRNEVRLTRSVRAHADLLAPGVWVAVRPQNKLWHHIDADLPQTLFGAKGKVTASAASRRIDGSGRLQRAQQMAFRALAWLAGARQHIAIFPVSEGTGTATVLASVEGTRAGLVAMVPGERAVRIGRAGAFDEAYIDVRQRFERHVTSPSFSVSADGALMTEEWCDGPLLLQLPVAQRLPHALAVLEMFSDLVTQEAVHDHESVWHQLTAMLEQADLPGWLAEPLGDDRIARLLDSQLLVPAQGDLGPHNIIIHSGSNTPMVIDFDTAGWEPVWLGPMKLAWRTAGDESTRGEVEGVLADALDRIWVSAGMIGVGGLTARHWLALVVSATALRDLVGRSPLSAYKLDVAEFSAYVEAGAAASVKQAHLESYWSRQWDNISRRYNAC